ncbi:MAG: hypothetical protein PVH29_09020 [Candidatus Zixiibacteriota bacterium]|jgi:hypothetical protein
MSEHTDRVKMARPGEPEVVKTTIVGGQPPRSGRSMGEVPRGVEVLVKKAAVDPAFKKVLLSKRARAAEDIGLSLEPAEAAMLGAVPEDQLRAIIGRTKVSPSLRPAFLGAVAAAMLAALAASGCKPPRPEEDPIDRGIDPDYPDDPYSEEASAETAATVEPYPSTMDIETGIRPDVPEEKGK